jgi:Tfp pilus assembly protein PilO
MRFEFSNYVKSKPYIVITILFVFIIAGLLTTLVFQACLNMKKTASADLTNCLRTKSYEMKYLQNIKLSLIKIKRQIDIDSFKK